MANCLRDGLPDRWGRRVIINRLTGLKADAATNTEFSDLTYMLQSGSDRIGALDFQTSATNYVPRNEGNASLDDLAAFADFVEAGASVPPDLAQAILHASSIGGARPKALLDDAGRKLIAKFSASSDVFSMVKAEFIAMRLAQLAGINAAPVGLMQAMAKDALIVERFDRVARSDGRFTRRAMVSALTIFGAHEISAHHCSYSDLADTVRARFTNPRETLHELFLRMIFNILVGNTDDHARNHAAFWDGNLLTLTPAYDIAPQIRAGYEANQAILISGNDRRSRLATCLAAAEKFHLQISDARAIMHGAIDTILHHWRNVCDEAQLPKVDRKAFAGRQFLNPYAFDELGTVPIL